MDIISEPSDLQRVYLDKIFKSVSDLSSTVDTSHFVRKMIRLSAILDSFDRNFVKSIPKIDENAQDPTYFIAAYFDTKNIAVAIWVYRIVRSLTKYILLSDRLYETGEYQYALLAKLVLRSVNEFLRSECDSQHLIYSIDYFLGQFSAFWELERVIKRRLLENYAFSCNEIRHFILSKSSDASLVYAKVLDAKLPSFNQNVALLLHYNQVYWTTGKI